MFALSDLGLELVLALPSAFLSALVSIWVAHVWQSAGGSGAGGGGALRAPANVNLTFVSAITVNFGAPTLRMPRWGRPARVSWEWVLGVIAATTLATIAALNLAAAVHVQLLAEIRGCLHIAGSGGFAATLTLLAAVAVRRRHLPAWWIGRLVALAALFAGVFCLPWGIDAASYPFKDWDRVLEHLELRPYEVASVYGSFGVFFVLFQLAGSIAGLVCAAWAVWALAATKPPDVTAARPSTRPLALAAVALLAAWLLVTGLGHRAFGSSSYSRDGQAPQMYAAELRRPSMSSAVLSLILDEGAAVSAQLEEWKPPARPGRGAPWRVVETWRWEREPGQVVEHLEWDALPRGARPRLRVIAADAAGRRTTLVWKLVERGGR